MKEEGRMLDEEVCELKDHINEIKHKIEMYKIGFSSNYCELKA